MQKTVYIDFKDNERQLLTKVLILQKFRPRLVEAPFMMHARKEPNNQKNKLNLCLSEKNCITP